ncbi:MAG: cupin domain-containing protein [Anaerolineaceae bacterium]|nr:MAG: cupin domain-containing protein [Anaerolineaceae bacterium]
MKPAIYHLRADAEYYTDEHCYINEVANHEGDPAMSIAQARVEIGVTTEWHRLKNTVERYVILSGEGLVEVGDLPPTPVRAGDVVVIPAMCRQRITNIGASDLLFLAICTPRFVPAAYEVAE